MSMYGLAYSFINPKDKDKDLFIGPQEFVVGYSKAPEQLQREDKDLFIGPQEFIVGYSKAPEQPQSSARPICHSHAMTRAGRELATIRIAA